MTALFEGVGIALSSLRAHKMRAALTILGVAIGVMVVMIIASMISGINRSVQQTFESIAPRTFLVWRWFQAGVNISDGSEETSPWRRNPVITGEEADRIALIRGDGPRPEPMGYPAPSCWIGLEIAAPALRERIAQRARAQFEAGLVGEAAALRERFDSTLPAFSAIGYREAFAVLDGTLGRDEAIELDGTRNAAFARRQRTWFRSEPGIRWLAPDEARHHALGIARELLGA